MQSDKTSAVQSLAGKLLYPFISGKNSKFAYFTLCALRGLVPAHVCRIRLPGILERGLKKYDRDSVYDRVDYYNKLSAKTPLSPDSPRLSEQRIGFKGQVYFFDTREFTRFFSQDMRWRHLPGDITEIPSEPSIVKSRPIAGDNANAVLLNLNKTRHFIFVNDNIPFSRKKDVAVFRGKVHNKQKRIALFRKHFGNPQIDLGDTSSRSTDSDEWKTGKLTLKQQLEFKFILAIEGNDVASNLKWVMSSNSIAMMPRPEFETWFMEGRLIPNVHYIEIAPDYSDLLEKIEYYASHMDEAASIIDNAHRYVRQFLNPERERLISLLVLKKYFSHTN